MMKKFSLSFISILAAVTILSLLNVLGAPTVHASTNNIPLVCSTKYSVEIIKSQSDYDLVGCYDSLDQAISQMKTTARSQKNVVVRHSDSLSPLKIVAMDRGIVVNVPGRGNTSSQSVTSLIYKTADFRNTTGRSYVTTYHTLSYFGSTLSRGEVVYNIGITGFKGYIRASQADLVPMIYLENNWPILLAGNGNGSGIISNRIKPNVYRVTSGSPNNEMNYHYSMVNPAATGRTVNITGYIYFDSSYITKISEDGDKATYRASADSIRIRSSAPNGSILNHVNSGDIFVGENGDVGDWIKISSFSTPFESRNAYNHSSLTYGAAPNWLKPGIDYYSWDGIHFYSDIEMTKPVNNGAAYYNYFQFLPARSETNHSAEALDKFILDGVGSRKSNMKDTGEYFLKGQEDHFMNALLVHAMAINESGYGRSTFALNYNNLFGWNAVDSNPNNAKHFDSIAIGIDEHMGINLNGYLRLSDSRYAGNGVGQKESGFNKQYASDAYWGLKISNFMYDLDKDNGQIDLNYYTLGKLPDNTAVNVRKEPSTSAGVYYTTRDDIINQMVIVLDKEGDWYKVYLQNITDGSKTGYIFADLIDIVNEGEFSLPTPKPTPTFSDVPADSFGASEIKFLSDLGAISGYEDGSFKPNNSMTRAAAAKIFAEALDLETSGVSSNYSDISSDHWAYDYISAVTEAGIVQGNTNNQFKPNDSITRAQMSVMLHRAFKDNLSLSGSSDKFTDISEEHFAYEAISDLSANGIINGLEDGTFGPNLNIKRSQFSVMMVRALNIQ